MSYYKNGIVSIPNVSGDVVITATAVQGYVPELFPTQFFETDGVTVYNNGLGYKPGYRFGSSKGESTATLLCVTGYLAVSVGDVITITGATHPPAQGMYPIIGYDASHNVVSSYEPVAYDTATTANGTFTIPSGVSYIRICTGTSSADAGTRTISVKK